MKVGIWFRIKVTLGQMFHNRFRFFLTVCGLFLSLLLFLGSYLFMDSLYFSKFNRITFWKENDLAFFDLTTTKASEADKQLMTELFGNKFLDFRYETGVTLKYPVEYDGKQVMLHLPIFRVNSAFSGSLVMENGMPAPSRLIAGTGITQDNIKNRENVIVIGSTLAQLLFGEDAIGKTVRIPYQVFEPGAGGVVSVREEFRELRVVGVYEDSYEKQNEFGESVGDVRIFSTNAYIPYSVLLTDVKAEGTEYILYTGKGQETAAIGEFKAKASSLAVCHTYDSLYEQIKVEFSGVRKVMNLITILILILSAFMISQTMVFSVKERISEFGIKRALGASAEAIACDLILEAVLYSIIAFVAAFLCAIFGVLIALNVAKAMKLVSDVSFYVQPKSILIGGLLALFTCLMAVIVPLWYLTKRSIVDTIRFE